MNFRSKNMNYIFNVEYFEGLDLQNEKQECLDEKNKALESFQFSPVDIMSGMEEVQGFETTSLFTCYPGLMIGTGNPHNLSIKGFIKCGFTFDYITGLPYLPGASLKGLLRSCFPGDEKSRETSKEFANLISDMLQNQYMKTEEAIEALKQNVFENNDIFLGAYPVIPKTNQKTSGREFSILQMEYITPHNQGKFKNPVPINLLKVKSNVEFKFCYLLHDFHYKIGDQEVTTITVKQKKELFKQLILLMGAGAKTNVGFGRFSDRREGVPG